LSFYESIKTYTFNFIFANFVDAHPVLEQCHIKVWNFCLCRNYKHYSQDLKKQLMEKMGWIIIVYSERSFSCFLMECSIKRMKLIYKIWKVLMQISLGDTLSWFINLFTFYILYIWFIQYGTFTNILRNNLNCSTIHERV